MKMFAIFIIYKGKRRKIPAMLAMFVSSLAFFVILLFDKGQYTHDWPIAACGIIGCCAVAFFFAVNWVFVAELFPTSIR